MFEPLTKEQFNKALSAGFTQQQIIEMEKKRKAEQSSGLQKVGNVAATLAPKSVEGFGETLGTALATPMLKKQETQEMNENTLLQNQIIKKIQDPNVSKEQKLKLTKLSQELGISTIGQVEAVNKSTKKIAGEALGVLGTVALGAKPSENIIGRLGFATAFGAGAGAKESLEQEKSALQTLSNSAKGAVTGLATGLFFEGIFAGIRKTLPNLGKNTYNKELQPDTNELAVSIKRNAETFGEKVRNVKDAAGKPVYVGGYKTLLDTGKEQVKSNGSKLEGLLKAADTDGFKTSRNQIAGDIIERLQEQYGALTPNQLKTVQMFVKKMPQQMNRTEMLKNKRFYDALISNTDWGKIVLGDSQASFAGQVKYILRDNLKNAIQDSTDDALIKALNQKMAIGMEVRDLAAKQLAVRAKMKVGAGQMGVLSKISTKIWDDFFFNPALTTRASQFANKAKDLVPGIKTQLLEQSILSK